MKNTFASLFLLTLIFIFSPEKVYSDVTTKLITEVQVFDNDSTFKLMYFYDTQGNKVLETKYYMNSQSWSLLSQTEWIYDGKNCTTQRESKWSTSKWNITYTIDYQYVNNQLMSELQQQNISGNPHQVKKTEYQYINLKQTSKKEYSWIADLWVLSIETSYTYLLDGNSETVTTALYQNGTVTDQYKSTFLYNANGTLATQLLQQKTAITNWTNIELINWYYVSGTTNILSQRCKKWLSDTSSWENLQKTENQYDTNNQLTSESFQRWKSMFWDNDIRYDYVYDNNNLEVKKILSLPIYHVWRSIVSINYSNYTDKKAGLIESKFEFWGGNTGELTTSFIPFDFNNSVVLQKGKSVQIVYASFNALPQIREGISSIPVYPNPSNGIYYIDTQKYGVESWSVSNLKGQILKNQIQTAQSGVIDITDFPKGIYILRVETAKNQFIQKLIKE